MNGFHKRWATMLFAISMSCAFAIGRADAQNAFQTTPGTQGSDAVGTLQTGTGSGNGGDAAASPNDAVSSRVVLARSTASYPVTPGDTYKLSFAQASGQGSVLVVVDADYTVNLGVFGTIDGAGKSFSKLKDEVEQRVANAYPSSAPDFELVSVGEFTVYLRGEVPTAEYVQAWGLSRLSDVVSGRLGPYSSQRKITVTSAPVAGKTASATYDFFAARRFGEIGDNPLMKPGDVVTVEPAGPVVRLAGEVRRSGSYELLPGDTLQTLIDRYGGGTEAPADIHRVIIDRSDGASPERLYVDFSTESGMDTRLSDGDVVTVRSKDLDLPAVTFEGAVVDASADNAGQADIPNAGGTGTIQRPYGYLSYSFRPGETVGDALRAVAQKIRPSADLTNVEILGNDGDPRSIDAAALLHGSAGDDPPNDPALEPFERIVVPWAPSVVSVTGAVMSPGAFAYEPGKGAQYYVSLAGGVDTQKNSGGIAAVFDASGNAMPAGGSIRPGDRVTVPENNALYHFNQVFPAIATSVSLITAIVTLANIIMPYVSH